MSHLYYIHDPMCSWCYAFTQSWTDLQKMLPIGVQVTYIVGGLAPDNTEPMPISTQETVQRAWRKIEQTVPSVHFNWDFWSQNIPYRSTYPACRAVLAAKKQHPTSEIKMIRAIQAAYYQKAQNPSLLDILQECAHEIGLNTAQFAQDIMSTEIEDELQSEIHVTRAMDVYSYPSLRLLYHEQFHTITIDYRHYQTMLDQINSIVQ